MKVVTSLRTRRRLSLPSSSRAASRRFSTSPSLDGLARRSLIRSQTALSTVLMTHCSRSSGGGSHGAWWIADAAARIAQTGGSATISSRVATSAPRRPSVTTCFISRASSPNLWPNRAAPTTSSVSAVISPAISTSGGRGLTEVVDEGLDRRVHQLAHVLHVPLGHHRVQHHPVAPPRLRLVGEEVQPQHAAQELVFDRLVVGVRAVVEHVVHVVRVADHHQGPEAHAGADDVLAVCGHDRAVDREAVHQNVPGNGRPAHRGRPPIRSRHGRHTATSVR